MFLTNKENFVASTGDYAATQINSDNMLWSLSGSIAMIYKVLFGMQYSEEAITFAVKELGSAMRPRPVEAEFAYARAFPAALADAYTALLHDAMRGDATIFTRRDEVEAAWRIITPIAEAWAQLPPPRFPDYAAGSDGPAAARSLVEGRRHQWCAIGAIGAAGDPADGGDAE